MFQHLYSPFESILTQNVKTLKKNLHTSILVIKKNDIILKLAEKNYCFMIVYSNEAVERVEASVKRHLLI